MGTSSRLGLTLAALVLLGSAGCGADREDTTADAFQGPVASGEGAVNVLAWPGYVMRDADTEHGWVTDFQDETGCVVNQREITSSDEALTLIADGGWDVVSAASDASLRLIEEGEVQPINTSLIPSYGDLSDDLKEQDWNSADGSTYGVPMGRIANVMLYDSKRIEKAPKSWSVVYEPDSDEAGRVSAYDNPISIGDAAVYLMSTQPELSITDPFSLDEAQFQAAVAVVEQQHPLVQGYWTDYLLQAASFGLGDVSVGVGWKVTAKVAEAADADVRTTIPEEGTTGRADVWMITRESTNINCAYKWIDRVTSPDVNAAAAEYVGAAPANEKACAETDDEDYCDKAHADDEEYWEQVHFWRTPSEECIDGRTVECTPYSEWVEAWNELRSRPLATETSTTGSPTTDGSTTEGSAAAAPADTAASS